MKKTLILVFIAVMVSFAVSYAQKNETVTYQDFIEGKMAFEENCLECHSLEWPLKKIATREEWELTLTNVQSATVWSGPWRRTRNSRPGSKLSGAWQPKSRNI
jgi:hypothetical protein